MKMNRLEAAITTWLPEEALFKDHKYHKYQVSNIFKTLFTSSLFKKVALRTKLMFFENPRTTFL